MARKPTKKAPAKKAAGALPRKPKSKAAPSVKAAADRAEARAKGKPIPEPKHVPISPESKAKIDPPIVKMAEEEAERPKHPGGRPTAYRPEFVEIAREMCANGATDFELAEEFGVDVRTVWRWTAKHPEFCQALKAKEGYDDRVERKLAERALGYSYHTVKVFQFQGVPVTVPYVEHVPPDPGAAKLWLANRRPKEWREPTQRLEHTGADGGAIQVEQRSEIMEARRIAFALGQALRLQQAKVIDAA